MALISTTKQITRTEDSDRSGYALLDMYYTELLSLTMDLQKNDLFDFFLYSSAGSQYKLWMIFAE